MAAAYPSSSSSSRPSFAFLPETEDNNNSDQAADTEDSADEMADELLEHVGQSQGCPSPTMLDYSYTGMESPDFAEALANQPSKVFSSVETILATNNSLLQLPDSLSRYVNLRTMDLSYNQLTSIPDCITHCINLASIVAKHNLLDEDSFPKNFSQLTKLKELNISGNLLTRVPYEILELNSLAALHLGANRINFVPKEICWLKKLEVLYLGGNMITEIPTEIGELTHLKVFVLCDNRLEEIPASVCNLKQLKSLLLHRNHITALPVELIKLRNLMELSLRDNPLVVRFVREMVHNPPSLLELAGRIIKVKKIPYAQAELPQSLVDYLTCAHECVNPRCKGVYFDTRVEHIKFVDFCGKYRIPLLQYLCSPKCSDNQSPAYEHSDSDSEDDRIRKVLLG